MISSKHGNNSFQTSAFARLRLRRSGMRAPIKSMKMNGLFRAILIAAVVLFVSCSLMAGPVIVSINDTPSGHVVVQVQGAPDGWTVIPDNDTGLEAGFIVLYGFDQGGLIPEVAGRFMDPRDWTTLPPFYAPDIAPGNLRQYRMALDIIYIFHHPETGDLVIEYDSATPGNWFWNPEVIGDQNLGPVKDNWLTFYEDDTLVVRFKAHTYALRK
jgi:hypothetical protein